MDYVRLIHPIEFDPGIGKYHYRAFGVSSNRGVSVIEPTCAVERSGTLCTHAQRYYCKKTKGDPAILWFIDSQHVIKNVNKREDTQAITIEHTTSQNNEDKHCHFEFFGITPGSAKRYGLNHAWPHNNMWGCMPHTAIPLTKELAIQLRQQAIKRLKEGQG